MTEEILLLLRSVLPNPSLKGLITQGCTVLTTVFYGTTVDFLDFQKGLPWGNSLGPDHCPINITQVSGLDPDRKTHQKTRRVGKAFIPTLPTGTVPSHCSNLLTLEWRHWILDTGLCTVDSGHWSLNTGFKQWTQYYGRNTQDTKLWTMGSVHWTQHSVHMTMALGHENIDLGHRTLQLTMSVPCCFLFALDSRLKRLKDEEGISLFQTMTALVAEATDLVLGNATIWFSDPGEWLKSLTPHCHNSHPSILN